MGLIAKAAAALAIMTLPMSCVRFEFDDSDEVGVDVSSEALRVSDEDSVVLCPLAASVEASGNVSIVWAGYPAADDRLQLMHARVSSQGAMVQEPQGLALLPDELVLLSVDTTDAGQVVQAIARDANESLRIELSDSGLVQGAYHEAVEPDGALAATSDSSCEATVFTASARLQIWRTHIDGELPLFVESFSL